MASKKKLRVMSLGGLHEIGKNMTVFEYGNDIIIVDCGVAFPDDDLLGIDLVIPDFSYLTQNAEKIRGIFITHGHEDHIGGIPYLLRAINAPIHGTKLTCGLVGNRLKEHKIKAKLNVVEAGAIVNAGCFRVEFINVNHSIPDACALAIRCPIGLVVHSGDFKVDYTPPQGEVIDLARFAELGKEGVKLFLCESTNVESKGFNVSEQSVSDVIENIFTNSKKQRVMIATFSSNVHRIAEVIKCAEKQKRKVCVLGRSMVNAIDKSLELGYIKCKSRDIFIEPSQLSNFTPDKICILTTGSQGEPMAALSRIASGDHRQVEILPNDKVVLSSSPIPGNEKTISKVINSLLLKGAEVIYEGILDIHVSGHAKQEELKLLHTLIKPEYVMPIHGEYRHLKTHKDLAVSLGTKKEKVFVMGIGDVLELDKKTAKLNGTVPSGRVLVDGLGVGDVGSVVLRDRKHLSEDGLIAIIIGVDTANKDVVTNPEIISRGFVYVKESDELMGEMRELVNDCLDTVNIQNNKDINNLKNVIREDLREFIWQKTKRNPMILPIIIQV